MNNPVQNTSRRRAGLLTAAASVAVAAGIGIGSLTAGSLPVLADPVTIEQPQTMPSFANVVEAVSPAVVSVRVKSDIRPASNDGFTFNFNGQGLEDLPEDHPMRRFFEQFGFGDRDFGDRGPRGRGFQERVRPTSQGSGFFISGDGYLVTNNHVVEGGSEYEVVLDDGTELEAELVGTDPRTDLAVMKVDADREFTYVEFAQDDTVRIGDWVVAVGNPFGLGGTVTAGIVSALGREIGAGPYDDFIQIDAAVNRGNSGGPAFNMKGEVVGINTAIFSPSGGNVGIAFAIPASLAKDVVTDLIDDGKVERGWLGVQIQPVTEDIAESVGLNKAEGAIVAEAQEDSPARKAGVRSGDIITAVNGKAVESPRELARVIAAIEPDAETKLTIWRDGKSQEITIELGKMPPAERQAALQQDQPDAEAAEGQTLGKFGLTVAPADDGEGVVVTDVQPDSEAAERGIEPGDVIKEVNSMAVSSAKEVEDAVAAASKDGRKSVLVQLERDDTNRFVALPVAKS